MADPAASRARYLRFGAFELDVRTGELRKHGIRLRLREQPFQILLMLLQDPGEIVLREDIRQKLWPNNTIVEFDHSINAAIKRLRDALGETAERPRYIETLARRGYRFLGEVERGGEAATVASPVDLDEVEVQPEDEPVSGLDMADLSGETISHYRVLEKLGAGGMGLVFRAEDFRLGRHVALKFLPDEVARDPLARQRFERETRAASTLNHPNICTIYGVEECDGRSILAMELLEGETLHARLERGSLPRQEALGMAVQIAAALDAAHRRGVVHRDIKPENVMLTKTGVKVLDFGLAKMVRVVPDAEEGLTETGVILGTLQYMSPEQVQGKDMDPRSDIFSFGLVLYEMVTGRRAFEEPGRADLIAAILHKEPDCGELPPALERLTKKCLAKDPDARWQSAADLRDELEWVAIGGGERRRASRFKFRVPVKLTLAIAGVAVAFLAAGIYLADRPYVDLSHVRFTPMAMDPGYNEFPQWSPDGHSFAYMHTGVLMLRALDAPVPVRLAGPRVYSVVFAKDGKRLYFTSDTSAGTGRKVWTVAVAGGDPQELPAEDLGGGYLFDGITMSPDGSALIALRQEPDRSFALCSSSPPGAPWKRLPYESFKSPPVGSAHLRFSPDGAKLLAVLGTLPTQFWILPWPAVPGREPRRVFASLISAGSGAALTVLTNVGSGADWMADSRHLLMHVSGTEEGEGGQYLGDTLTGRIYPLEMRDSQSRQPSAFPDGRFLVPYNDQDSDIIEVPLDGSAPRPLIATKRTDSSPDWSRSGDQMVYVTNRNGPGEIWIWSPASNFQRPLITQHSLPGGLHNFGSPMFSPDGKRVAFETEQDTIWVVPATGGSALAVLPPDGHPSLPTWSPDGQWLAYRVNRGGKLLLEKVRVGTDRPIAIHETAQGVRPLWSPDGRWIALAVADGLGIVSPDGQIAKHVHGLVSNWTAAGWSRDGKTLYVAITDGAADPMTSTLWAIDPEAARERAIGHYTGLWFGAAPTFNLSPSPDGKSLAATSVKPYVYIWLIEGLTPPRNIWQRLFSRP